MSFENSKGTPLVAAFIVLLAIASLFGLSVAFSGSVQF